MANAANDAKTLPPGVYQLFRDIAEHILHIWKLSAKLEELLGKEVRYSDIEAATVGCDSSKDIDDFTIDAIVTEW